MFPPRLPPSSCSLLPAIGRAAKNKIYCYCFVRFLYTVEDQSPPCGFLIGKKTKTYITSVINKGGIVRVPIRDFGKNRALRRICALS